MHILISPNAFKNSLSASRAATAIQEGLEQSRLVCTCEQFAIGDGGDGTGELVIEHLKGRTITMKAFDPLRRPVETTYGLIDNGRTAVIEMANASGLRLLKADELDPLVANSYGTGEQIRAALQCGVSRIVIGMGGSATVDGGCGMLSALGVRFLDASGRDIAELPGGLQALHSIDTSLMDPALAGCEVIILCDVNNVLLGSRGAARVFGPQKGATTPAVVEQLEACLLRLSEVILKQTSCNIAGLKHSGTAGGAAAALHALINAKMVNGIDYFLELTGYDARLQRSNLVITGEGCIDDQTLDGKGPFGVACKARSKGLAVVGLAGSVPVTISPSLQEYFDVLLSIGHAPSSLEEAMQVTAENLSRTAFQVGNLLACTQ